MLAYQSALQVVGNNISNAGSPSYTRQSPVLTPSTGVILPENFTPGGGVALTGLRRNIDEALENRLRVAIGDQQSSLIEQQTIGRIEGILNEMSDSDLSTLMQEFFNSFTALQNSPEEESTRQMVLANANTLIDEIQRQREDTLTIRDELNKTIEETTDQANNLASQIADVNVQIVTVESVNEGGANALRDQRDSLLRELSELVQIEVREQEDGGVNVYVGNEPLIQGGINRGLTTTLEVEDNEPRRVVRFGDNTGPLTLRGGKLAGLIEVRDAHVMGHVQDLDGLATALIQEVNKAHALGQGLEGFTEVTGTYDVLDSQAVLDSENAGLDFTPQNGSFLLTVKDTNSGATNTYTIDVDLDGFDNDETLDRLALKISAAEHINAAATSDNRLRIEADDSFEFSFAEDSSNVLAGLGINTFFSGSDGEDISVNSVLEAEGGAQLLAAASGGGPGDGANAALLAGLATESLDGLGGQSVMDYYNNLATSIAVKGSAANAAVEAADSVASSLNAQRESVSGVSLDEETISLLRLERAFQGAARFTSTVNKLMEETLALAG